MTGGVFDGLRNTEPWQERALCREVDPDLFCAEGKGSSASTRAAKRICTGCEVRAECLEYALREDIPAGVYGGLSAKERHKLRPAKKRGTRPQWLLDPCGTPAAYQRHYRNGEKPCPLCVEANSVRAADRKARREKGGAA